MISYWKWFFYGSGDGPGLRRFFDLWILLHLGVGALFAYFLPITLEKSGASLILPLSGIFIGLSFAWGGNALALLQTSEIIELTTHRRGGYVEYLYTYQSAILLILISLCLWGVAGLGIFDKVWPICRTGIAYKSIVLILFAVSSMSLRECWHVVLGAQYMLLIRVMVQKKINKKKAMRNRPFNRK
ncbi:MAG: hypothetical protein U7M05_07570 [Candidatus Igneacidithiobacillus chanchocoensis]